jgi:cation/acetate symporter
MSAGMISSTVLIILSNPVWPGSTSPLGSLALDNPAIFCIPIGFLGCFLGTKLSKERDNERQYEELYVRSETGVGAEVAGGRAAPEPRGREEAKPEPVGTR